MATKVNLYLPKNQTPDKKKIERIIKNFLKKFNLKNYQVALHLVNKTKIRRLNRDYRNINKATDVLSFPIDEPVKNERKNDEEKIILGDIFICLSELKLGLEETIKHGLVHLLGFSHETDSQEKQFNEQLEK
jgi:probable rRNA maturation factor